VSDTEPRSLSPTALRELAQLLSQAERSVTRRLARVLEQEGCTVEQWRTLVVLADGAGHGMSQLAESALLPPPSVTRLIDRMVDDNLVYRTADVGDRRRVLVLSTPRGRARHRRLTQRIEREQQAILADIYPGDLDQLMTLLGDLVERMDSPPRTNRPE
jgi:MarR family transcriptional regulator, organic hydroperoxide resistance regulator